MYKRQVVTWSGNNERTNGLYDEEESVLVAGDERTGDDDLVDVCDVPRQGHAEPESVAALRLRLALAREERTTREKEWEIEKERMNMQSGVKGQPKMLVAGQTSKT